MKKEIHVYTSQCFYNNVIYLAINLSTVTETEDDS